MAQQNETLRFTVSFKDRADTIEKFTIDHPLPVITYDEGEVVAADFSRGTGTWESIVLTNFRVVERGEVDPDQGEGSVPFEEGRPISTQQFPTFRTRDHLRVVAFSVEFTAKDPRKVVTIDPIFIENPGNPH